MSNYILCSLNIVPLKDYEEFIHTIFNDMDSSGLVRICCHLLTDHNLTQMFLPSDKIFEKLVGKCYYYFSYLNRSICFILGIL